MNSNTNEKMTLTAEDYKNFKSIRTLGSSTLALSIISFISWLLILISALINPLILTGVVLLLVGVGIASLVLSLLVLIKMSRYHNLISKHTTYLVLIFLGNVLLIGGILMIIASAMIISDKDITGRCNAPKEMSPQDIPSV